MLTIQNTVYKVALARPMYPEGASSQMQAGLPGHGCGEGATPTLSAPFGAAGDLCWPDTALKHLPSSGASDVGLSGSPCPHLSAKYPKS